MPEHLLAECFDRIRAATGLHPPAGVLDAGCGTAQLSVPLMAAGFDVVGLDVSAAMLEVARTKLQPEWSARFEVGDVRSMDFPDGHFDATVVSKLFQHVGNWTAAADEICRVTRHGGLFVHVNEKGAFKNAVRQRFAAECDSRGHIDRYRGLRDRSLLAEYLVELGARPVPVDVTGLTWTKTITYEEALEHLALRLHSEFWLLPDDEYEDILEGVRDWVLASPAGPSTTELMQPYLTAEVFEIP